MSTENEVLPLKIRVHDRAGKEAEYTFAGRASLGKDPGCDVVLKGLLIGKTQATLEPRNGHWYIEDQGGLASTLVNGEQITSYGPLTSGDRIEIEARREGDLLLLEVRNGNSTLESEGRPGGHGIGLSNTRLRLRELYGDDADLRLYMIWPQGVACRIRLPFRELVDSDDQAEDPPEHVPA